MHKEKTHNDKNRIPDTETDIIATPTDYSGNTQISNNTGGKAKEHHGSENGNYASRALGPEGDDEPGRLTNPEDFREEFEEEAFQTEPWIL